MAGPTPYELAKAFVTDNRYGLGMSPATPLLGYGPEIGGSTYQGINVNGFIDALNSLFSVQNPNGQSIVSLNDIQNKLNAAGVNAESIKTQPGKFLEVVRKIGRAHV